MFILSRLHDRSSEQAKQEKDRIAEVLTEQRPWGSFELFTVNENSTVKLLHVRKGKRLSLQYHSKRSELWKIVTGKVSVTINSTTAILSKGEGITIPIGTIHRIKGIEDSTILEIAFGEFDENDIIRLHDDFGRIGSVARKNQVSKQVQNPITHIENSNDVCFQAPVRISTDQNSTSDMIQLCKEEENMERRVEMLRKINASLPEKQRLIIPSLITVHYIDRALEDLEERILQVLSNHN